jgi:AbrB family looped-hinge helix DNA binding protein
MSETALVKVTRKGQMTIPQELRKELDIEPGDYVTLRALSGGIFVSKAIVTPEVQAEDVLRSLVISLGEAAEEQGIREDQDLDAVIDELQDRIHQERYGE